MVECGAGAIFRRSRCLLVTLGGVGVPSDLAGILTIQAGEWDDTVAHEVARGLRDMGLSVSVADILQGG